MLSSYKTCSAVSASDSALPITIFGSGGLGTKTFTASSSTPLNEKIIVSIDSIKLALACGIRNTKIAKERIATAK